MTDKQTQEFASMERHESPTLESYEKDVDHRKDVDVTAKFAAESDDLTWSPQEERKILRKIDMVILSLLFVGSVMTYADTQAYGVSALFGLVQDLGLYTISPTGVVSTERYSFSSGIIQLGAIAGQYPLLLLAQHLPNGKFLSATVVYTGMCALLIITCHDYAEVLALRFFNGFGIVTSALAVIITSMWWKTDEQPFRVGIFIAGSALGNLIGQAVDLGAVDVKGAYAAEPWKWIYVILGSCAMGYGVVAFFIFPASPMDAWFLNERERHIAVRRLVTNNTGIQTKIFKIGHVKEVVLDPQLYLMGVFAFGYAFVNSATGSFSAFLVSSFGYTDRRSLVLLMPASAVATVSMIISGYLGTTFPRWRIANALFWILPSIIGTCFLWKGGNNIHLLLGGLYLSQTFYGALVQQFALVSANVSGHTKKTLFNGTLVILGNLGSFSGPFAYHADEASRHYPTGQIAALSLLSASLAAFSILWVYYVWRNKQKVAFRERHPEMVDDVKIALADYTDQENPIFTYVT